MPAYDSRFDAGNPFHARLAAFSRQARVLAKDLTGLEAQVNQAASELRGIADKELQEIRRSLAELG